ELPESSSANVTEITPITVALNQAGELTLNGEAIALEQLKAAIEPLLEQDSDAPVTLKSDAHSEVQQLLGVMDEIRSAGGSNIALATTQK
ncbi:MAG TPA: hypothetical protein ENJ07_03950, partial [Gammaproteobacteria bacterium]|nr:hypothetical protein [Gammaproteobacteria bacterium]